MKVILRDAHPVVADCLAAAFREYPEVEVGQGDIFERRAEAIVSPANSHGWMDGGIDLAYVKRFGWDLEKRLMLVIKRDHGALPVGQALAIETGNADIPWMICAPTMVVPSPVPNTLNAYLAFKATLSLAQQRGFASILCPGFCTLTGRMHPGLAANQMRRAYVEHLIALELA